MSQPPPSQYAEVDEEDGQYETRYDHQYQNYEDEYRSGPRYPDPRYHGPRYHEPWPPGPRPRYAGPGAGARYAATNNDLAHRVEMLERLIAFQQQVNDALLLAQKNATVQQPAPRKKDTECESSSSSDSEDGDADADASAPVRVVRIFGGGGRLGAV
jgi:hypothetical protein